MRLVADFNYELTPLDDVMFARMGSVFEEGWGTIGDEKDEVHNEGEDREEEDRTYGEDDDGDE
jgi:hypothetical protein